MDDFIKVAESVARAAGEILRAGYGRAEQIGFKGAVDLVTEYDTASEKYIVEHLQAAFPEPAIGAEEIDLVVSLDRIGYNSAAGYLQHIS